MENGTRRRPRAAFQGRVRQAGCSAGSKRGNVGANPGRETNVRGTAARILCVVALGLALAGCDKCGNFFGFHAPYGLDVCKPSPPKQ